MKRQKVDTKTAAAVDDGKNDTAQPVLSIDAQRQKVRTLCDFYYDVQAERIRTGNRIVASLRPDLVDAAKKAIDETVEAEAKPGESESDKDRKAAQLLKACLADYHLLHEQYADCIKTRSSLQKTIDRLGPELAAVKSAMDVAMVGVYDGMVSMEQSILKTLDAAVKEHPMYDAFFAGVSGCGTLVAAICLSYIDVHECRHASALWRYAGLDTVLDPETGKMEGRTRKHRVAQKYTDKYGNESVRMCLGYNPVLKTKVVEVFVGSVLKAYGASVARVRKANEEDGGCRPLPLPEGYVKTYYDYRNRLDNRPETRNYTASHKHRMAARYMAKAFLQDLWKTWRAIEGYPSDDDYAVAKLGMTPHGGDNKPFQDSLKD